MRLSLPLRLLISLSAMACALAQTVPHANFSGRWRMVKDESDFGKFTRPDIIVRVIDERGPTMNLHTVETASGKTNISDITYFTDGRESTNDRGGRPATSKAFWDGSDLMIRTDTTDSKNNRVQIVERWSLSPDGKQLKTTSDVATETGSAHLVLVCEKEAPPSGR